jgi:hypothetical protein
VIGQDIASPRGEMESWRVPVKNRSGLLVPDDAVMVSQSDVEQRPVDFAKREIRNSVKRRLTVTRIGSESSRFEKWETRPD